MTDKINVVRTAYPVQTQFLGVWHKYVREKCPNEVICCSPQMWMSLAFEFDKECESTLKETFKQGCAGLDLADVPVIECQWMQGEEIVIMKPDEWLLKKAEYVAEHV